jgi:hypothetical protein
MKEREKNQFRDIPEKKTKCRKYLSPRNIP